MSNLRSEKNTWGMARSVKNAFRAKHGRAGTVVFEHGQWWITESNGAQYSVVDATGPGSFDGFDFEQVTQGDDSDD